MNIYDYEPLERLEICMLLATLDNLDFTNISPEVEGLLVEFEEAGIITPDNTLVGRGQVDLTSKGYLFKKRAMRWLKTQGKLGLVELAILEKIVSGQIEAALHELKTAGLIKTYGAWGMPYPIRIDGEGAWKHVLTSQKPPAWQYEEEYSNMTTNNNISIGDYATVGVAGTNTGFAVAGTSVTLPADQIQNIYNYMDKIQSEIEEDEAVPSEASAAIGNIIADAKNKFADITKEEASKILEDTAQEAIQTAGQYVKGIVLKGISDILLTLPTILQSLPM